MIEKTKMRIIKKRKEEKKPMAERRGRERDRKKEREREREKKEQSLPMRCILGRRPLWN